MLEIEDSKTGEGEEAKEREQLVAPLHEGRLDARASACQRKKRLSILTIVGEFAHGRSSHADHS